MTLLLTKPNKNYGAAKKYLHVSNKCQKICNNLLADCNNILSIKPFQTERSAKFTTKKTMKTLQRQLSMAFDCKLKFSFS